MKTKFLAFAILFSLVFTSCSTTFDGYYYSVENAKNSESFYNQYDYIFTIEKENQIIDFIIDGNYMRIIKIECKEGKDSLLYKIRNKSTFLINEILAYSDTYEEQVWIKTGNYPFQVEWSVSYKTTEKNEEGFDFTYNGMECVLLYRIVE